MTEHTVARMAAEGMSPETQQLAALFDYGHLPEHLRAKSAPFAALAATQIQTLPDGLMLRVGLQHLWEAKNACVVAALPQEDPDPSTEVITHITTTGSGKTFIDGVEQLDD